MGIETLVIGGLIASAVGTGVQVMGSMKAADANKQIAADEMAAQAQQRQQMELTARRQQREVIRNQQKARSMALTTASSQGAMFGSGLAGAFGGISGASGNNMLGIDQNLEIGRNVADLNVDISGQKMNLADAQSMSAFGQGISSLGGDVMKSVPAFGRLGTNFNMTGSPFGASGTGYLY